MDAARFPPGFAAGVRRFNAGEFFEAHEAFEELLEAVEGDARWDLVLALVQIAVGYHKCASGYPGGTRMLGLGLAKLASFPALAWGLDVAALRTRVGEDLDALAHGAEPQARLAAAPPRLLMRRPREI